MRYHRPLDDWYLYGSARTDERRVVYIWLMKNWSNEQRDGGPVCRLRSKMTGIRFPASPLEFLEIGYLLLPSRGMVEIPLKRRKSSIQPTNPPVCRYKKSNLNKANTACIERARFWREDRESIIYKTLAGLTALQLEGSMNANRGTMLLLSRCCCFNDSSFISCFRKFWNLQSIFRAEI